MSSNRDLSTLLVTTERRSGELVKIIVAFRRLLESGDSAAALRSIEEILINVIGTEDFVVLSGGRRAPETTSPRISGDEAIGRRLVDSLAVTP